MMSDRNMYPNDDNGAELDRLFVAYRDACLEAEPGVNFMPELWSRIEAREVSSSLFGRMAKALVTAALAATVILGMMVSTMNRSENQFNGTYLEALSADHASTLEPLNFDRVTELEQH